MRTVLLTVSALVIGFPIAWSATIASAQTSIQASTWSPDTGASLFQSLGITVPGQDALSQIVQSTRPLNITLMPTASFPASLPASLPVSATISVPPPSTDMTSAASKVAGPSSASLSRASFVPQIAQQDGEVDPVLVAQIEPSAPMPSQSITVPVAAAVPISAYWGNILSQYAATNSGGLTEFDYAALKASSQDMSKLGDYINHMAAQKPSELSPGAAMAYWANLYNALTVQVVAQNYPVKSIRKIKSGYRAGPWKRDLVTVEDRKLSLDDIEHNILRPTYQTPLVHYMVNCASVGCPNLKATPWQAATLAADQEAAARAYINSPRGAQVNKGRLQVSSIYKWFKADFGGNEAGVLAHLTQYADADLKAALSGRHKIDKYTYDWDVNAPK